MSGIELKCERIRSKVPQYILAAALGITQTELSQYENEKRQLTAELQAQIKKKLKEVLKKHQTITR